MRISDWSSDVCSPDLHRETALRRVVGPALRHGLGAAVEADAVHAVLVEVAEARSLPAAEGMIGDRPRDRHVDAHHAHFDRTPQLAVGVAVAGEDGDAAAYVVRGGPFQFSRAEGGE